MPGESPLQERLKRYRSELLGGSSSHAPTESTPDAALVDPCLCPKAPMTFVRKFPGAHHHGRYALEDLYGVMRAWQASGIEHPLAPPVDVSAEDLIFFDTETTGLHHGAGTLVFLLGYARFEHGQCVVRQHFLTSPAQEASFYGRFFEEIQDARTLVTFNGKSFDWPQVRSRHTLLRSDLGPLPHLSHMDLLHPTRRVWVDELASCRLSEIERHKLSVMRTEDTPGSLAPILYFDYLRTRKLSTMEGVLLHNQWDVLSLITLYVHLSRLVLAHTSSSLSHRERFAISKWYEGLGQLSLAQAGYQAVAESQDALRFTAEFALGRCLKRQGDWRGCLSVWETLVSRQNLPSEEVLVELSKIYEHQVHDYRQSLDFAVRAHEAWKHKRRALHLTDMTGPSPHVGRMERLQGKMLRRQA